MKVCIPIGPLGLLHRQAFQAKAVAFQVAEPAATGYWNPWFTMNFRFSQWLGEK
ncbi:MAG: hypothetical protein AVDCRST_MAG56-5860 [uncultured Cytophagales bacterium]|uniref:Uncharacterized protein n=1 Tax=uncultured Cytophagales bacterium TaxID=158755 RepID=A0A6J4KJB0_9SPHI|nr:MAG: hypothetical protein AVDCRST_MAG56-5860 [uncultured Cytophagales bacterium]